MTREPGLMRLAERERTDLLALARTLTPEQWATESLCAGWSVRDVLVHVVSYDPLTSAGLARELLRGGLRVDRVNEHVLRRYDGVSTVGVLDLLARHRRPRGLTAGFGGGIGLTDGTIHHQDVRRALGQPRAIPDGHLVPVLDFARRAPTLPGRALTRGQRWTATDVAWSAGEGPEVTGPGEALLMAMSGRAAVVDELDGPGVGALRRRLAS